MQLSAASTFSKLWNESIKWSAPTSRNESDETKTRENWDVQNEAIAGTCLAQHHANTDDGAKGLAELVKMRLGDERPASFPRKYLRMWLSNVP